MFYRYSTAFNSLRPATQFASLKPAGVSSRSGTASDMFMLESGQLASVMREAARAQVKAAAQRRAIASTAVKHDTHHPVVDRTGPGSAPYGDPNVMLGVGSCLGLGKGGKLIPKLPKGTVVGNLVMGEHGMYSPSFRERQLSHLKAVENHQMTHLGSSWAKMRYYCAWFFLITSVYFTVINVYMLSTNHILFPYNVLYPDPKKK